MSPALDGRNGNLGLRCFWKESKTTGEVETQLPPPRPLPRDSQLSSRSQSLMWLCVYVSKHRYIALSCAFTTLHKQCHPACIFFSLLLFFAQHRDLSILIMQIDLGAHKTVNHLPCYLLLARILSPSLSYGFVYCLPPTGSSLRAALLSYISMNFQNLAGTVTGVKQAPNNFLLTKYLIQKTFLPM